MHFGTKKKITRDVLDQNECILEPLVRILGSRVSVDTIEFHLEAFYKFLEVPIEGPSALIILWRSHLLYSVPSIERLSCLGPALHVMAWQMKRLLSCFNRIACRPHRPRSRVIRALMEKAGIPVPAECEKGKGKRGEDSTSSSDGEGSETEEEASDDSVEEPLEPVAPPVVDGKEDAKEAENPPAAAIKETASPTGSTEAKEAESSPTATIKEKASPSESTESGHALPSPSGPLHLFKLLASCFVLSSSMGPGALRKFCQLHDLDVAR